MLPHIHPSQIDTPWEPQNIIWREGDSTSRESNLKNVIDTGVDFLVREAFVQHQDRKYEPTELSLEQVWDLLGHTDQEFELMRSVGIVPAPTEWHAFVDHEGTVRTLAKVAVIDGTVYKNPRVSGTSAEEAAKENEREAMVNEYLGLPNVGHRVYDVRRPSQFLFGQARNEELRMKHTPDAAHCLVDIESVYWLYRG